MLLEMLAYLVWIMLTLVTMGFLFHILRLDRPRPVRVPVHKDDFS